MTQKLLFVFCFVLMLAGVSAAQTRSISNIDLDKYRQERLKAEADLRENYAKLGFPSPEEREKRNAQSAKETAELSAKLRNERLERELAEAERSANAQYAAALLRAVQMSTPQYYEPSYFSGYYYGRRERPIGRAPYQQEGYFAGGQFWPTGPRTQPQPMLVKLRR